MNEQSLLILIHLIYIATMIIVLLIFQHKLSIKNLKIKITSLFILAINALFPVVILILSVIHQYIGVDVVYENIFYVVIAGFTLNFGIALSNSVFLFYILFTTVVSTVSTYYIYSKSMSLNQLILNLSAQLLTMFLIFSTNFLQLIFSFFCIDFVLALLLNNAVSQDKTKSKLVSGFLFSTLLGNSLIISSLLLLFSRVNSFTYNDFYYAIQYHLFIYKPYYKLAITLMLVGILLKIGTFPSQAWAKNLDIEQPINQDTTLFLVASFVFYPLLIFIITPLTEMLVLGSMFLLWYSLANGFIGILIAYFSSSKRDNFFGFNAAFQSIVLVFLSFNQFSIVDSLIVAFPCIVMIIASLYQIKAAGEDNSSKDSSKSSYFDKIANGIWMGVLLLFALGVIPINNAYLALATKWFSGSTSEICVVIAVSLLITLVNGIIVLLLMRNFVVIFAIQHSDTLLNVILAVILALRFVISPIANWVHVNDKNNYVLSYHYTILLAINIAILLILLTITIYWKSLQALKAKLSGVIQRGLTILYLPMLYQLIIYAYKVIIRLYIWIKLLIVESLIIETIYSKIVVVLSEITVYLLKVFDFIVNLISRTIIASSRYVKRFDKLGLHWQLVLIILFSASIFLVVFVYYLFKVI